MPNLAYLCCTEQETLYPSAVLENYDMALFTVAADFDHVPLLWPALFRSEDYFGETFESEEGELEVFAPIAEKPRALANLAAARRWYALAFPELGALDEHFDLFERALRDAPGAYVTIELEEIASLEEEDPEDYYQRFGEVLAALESEPTREAADALLELSGFRASRRFPPARLLLDDLSEDEDDHWNICRILGSGQSTTGFGRPAPWEPNGRS